MDKTDELDVVPLRANRQLCVRHKQMANQDVNQKLQRVSVYQVLGDLRARWARGGREGCVRGRVCAVSMTIDLNGRGRRADGQRSRGSRVAQWVGRGVVGTGRDIAGDKTHKTYIDVTR